MMLASPMARASRTIVHDDPDPAPVWTAAVLMASTVGAFAVLAVFLAHNHAWTDALMSKLPMPGAAESLGSDPVLAAQIRLVAPAAKFVTLADRSNAIVLTAAVVNDSPVPVRTVVIEAEALREGTGVARASAACGKNVSERLIKRMSRDEVRTLMRLRPSRAMVLAPGEKTECQVAIASIRGEVEEVSYRVASVEPNDDHLSVDLRPDPQPGPGIEE